MEKLGLIAFGIFILTSCNNTAKKSPEQAKNDSKALITAKGENKCPDSAGYTWSNIKKDCVNIFNIGFRLNPVKTENGETASSAFVLLSEDQSQAELFFPNDIQHPVTLKKVDEHHYRADRYTYDAYKSVLFSDGKIAYKGNVE